MEILNDFRTTVIKAFDEIDSNWASYKGLVICGTHDAHDEEALIEKIREARENEIPFLGICFGHQLAAIEYARNVLGITDATSEEFGTGTLIVKRLPKLKVGRIDGESYWNNYEVDAEFESKWQKPQHFFTYQFHPEYQSSKDKPHPLLLQFLNVCKYS